MSHVAKNKCFVLSTFRWEIKDRFCAKRGNFVCACLKIIFKGIVSWNRMAFCRFHCIQ
jgi:hypothetical protein